MHYTLSIITNEKPNEELIEELMLPYAEEIDAIPKENLCFEDGFWYNPKAKWNMYGVSSIQIPTKKGFCDFCKVKDIDWSYPRTVYSDYLQKYNDIITGKKEVFDNEGFNHRFSTKEIYAEYCSAILTPSLLIDGEWYDFQKKPFDTINLEELRNDINAFKKLVMKNPESWIVFLDCHI